MNILIIGAGALGIGVGTNLANSGCNVDFFARGENKTAIEREGISRTGWFGEISVPAGSVRAFDNYEALPENNYDYVIISTKTIANNEVSRQLNANRDCLAPNGKIVFMQNGLGYEKPFLEYFSKDKLYHSRVITGFKKDKPNVSVVTAHQAPILIGSLYGYDNHAVEPLAEAINASGIPAQTDIEIGKAIWAKLIYNTTLNPIGAILGLSYGELTDSKYARPVMDKLIEETFCIMKASGGETYWNDADEYKRVLFEEMIPVTYNHRSSTLQDIEKKQKTEMDTLTGILLQLAEEHEISAPTHWMIYSMVKALEEKF